MAKDLTSARRSELRAAAHKLAPVVIIGDKGLSDEVVGEIDRSLKAHELIKVRAATEDRAARAAWLGEICERLGAHPVQQIGKVLVVYRENEKEPERAKPPKRSPAGREPGKRRELSRTPGKPKPRKPPRLAEAPPPRRRRPRTAG
jgi:RNA-binding protein